MRLGKGSLKSAGTFSITYNLPYWWLKVSKKISNIGDTSIIAKQRLKMIEGYKILKNVKLICQIFGVSPKTFYKWKRCFEKGKRQLSSLENLPKTPIKKRQKQLDFKTELNIKHLREKYIRLGKVKLQKLFQKEYGYFVSQNHISYVISKYNLFYDKVKTKRIRTKKQKNKGKRKIRINKINPKDYLKDNNKPFFFCVDSIVLYLPYGVKRYILTAVDYEKKIAYARCYTNKSSLLAFDFILRLLMLVNGKISAVLSDNVSEFAKYFDEACKRLKIIHIYTRVKTPKDNSVNERFNRTLQEEFMETDEYFESLLTETDLKEANKRLTEWLIFYNLERPHQSLNYQTPIEWYNKNYKLMRVLPMYSTYTIY